MGSNVKGKKMFPDTGGHGLSELDRVMKALSVQVNEYLAKNPGLPSLESLTEADVFPDLVGERVDLPDTDIPKINAGSESSSSEDDDSTDDSDSDIYEKVPGTFPYNANSEEESDVDEDSDDNPDHQVKDACSEWRKAINASNKPTTEVITLDDDDDEIQGEMRCSKCPPGQSLYTKKSLFLLHQDRHKWRNHFVCPHCLKPFVKISYCFAHEIRRHGVNFDFEHELFGPAREYRKRKEREQQEIVSEEIASKLVAHVQDKQKAENEPCSSGSLRRPPNSAFAEVTRTAYGHNFTGLLLFPEEGEYETDEDDPKFYPGHSVPSTGLYPYRGIEPWSIYDCYEIHLRHGRKRRTAANTIARSYLARRRKLIEEGHVEQDDIGRFWKPEIVRRPPSPPPAPPARRRKAKPKRSKKSDSNSASTASTQSKRGRGRPPGKTQRPVKNTRKSRPPVLDTTAREFIAGVLAKRKVCVLCGQAWHTQEELKQHRDAKHKGRLLVELMTVENPKLKPQETENPESETSCAPPPKKKQKIEEAPKKPEYVRSAQENFLNLFGLISVKELAQRPPDKQQIRGKIFYFNDNAYLDMSHVRNNGRAYVCEIKNCHFYAKTREQVRRHKRNSHRNTDTRTPSTSSTANYFFQK